MNLGSSSATVRDSYVVVSVGAITAPRPLATGSTRSSPPGIYLCTSKNRRGFLIGAFGTHALGPPPGHPDQDEPDPPPAAPDPDPPLWPEP